MSRIKPNLADAMELGKNIRDTYLKTNKSLRQIADDLNIFSGEISLMDGYSEIKGLAYIRKSSDFNDLVEQGYTPSTSELGERHKIYFKPSKQPDNITIAKLNSVQLEQAVGAEMTPSVVSDSYASYMKDSKPEEQIPMYSKGGAEKVKVSPSEINAYEENGFIRGHPSDLDTTRIEPREIPSDIKNPQEDFSYEKGRITIDEMSQPEREGFLQKYSQKYSGLKNKMAIWLAALLLTSAVLFGAKDCDYSTSQKPEAEKKITDDRKDIASPLSREFKDYLTEKLGSPQEINIQSSSYLEQIATKSTPQVNTNLPEKAPEETQEVKAPEKIEIKIEGEVKKAIGRGGLSYLFKYLGENNNDSKSFWEFYKEMRSLNPEVFERGIDVNGDGLIDDWNGTKTIYVPGRYADQISESERVYEKDLQNPEKSESQKPSLEQKVSEKGSTDKKEIKTDYGKAKRDAAIERTKKIVESTPDLSVPETFTPTPVPEVKETRRGTNYEENLDTKPAPNVDDKGLVGIVNGNKDIQDTMKEPSTPTPETKYVEREQTPEQKTTRPKEQTPQPSQLPIKETSYDLGPKSLPPASDINVKEHEAEKLNSTENTDLPKEAEKIVKAAEKIKDTPQTQNTQTTSAQKQEQSQTSQQDPVYGPDLPKYQPALTQNSNVPESNPKSSTSTNNSSPEKDEIKFHESETLAGNGIEIKSTGIDHVDRGVLPAQPKPEEDYYPGKGIPYGETEKQSTPLIEKPASAPIISESQPTPSAQTGQSTPAPIIPEKSKPVSTNTQARVPSLTTLQGIAGNIPDISGIKPLQSSQEVKEKTTDVPQEPLDNIPMTTESGNLSVQATLPSGKKESSTIVPPTAPTTTQPTSDYQGQLSEALGKAINGGEVTYKVEKKIPSQTLNFMQKEIGLRLNRIDVSYRQSGKGQKGKVVASLYLDAGSNKIKVLKISSKDNPQLAQLMQTSIIANISEIILPRDLAIPEGHGFTYEFDF